MHNGYGTAIAYKKLKTKMKLYEIIVRVLQMQPKIETSKIPLTFNWLDLTQLGTSILCRYIDQPSRL